MARLKSELEVTCPCCQSTLVIDTNLGRVVSHKEPERGEQAGAERSAAHPRRRSGAARGDLPAVGRLREDARRRAVARFEEALSQAREEPITKPTRDFDLD